MKTITYNPETHVLVPREPSEEMCDAATADSCWEDMNPPPSVAYRSMLAAAPQPEPVESEPFGYYENGRFSVITDGGPDKYRERKGYQGAIYTTPQPVRVAELEAALKVARDALGSAKYVIEMAQLHKPGLKLAQQEALAKINEVLHD